MKLVPESWESCVEVHRGGSRTQLVPVAAGATGKGWGFRILRCGGGVPYSPEVGQAPQGGEGVMPSRCGAPLRPGDTELTSPASLLLGSLLYFPESRCLKIHRFTAFGHFPAVSGGGKSGPSAPPGPEREAHNVS